MIGKTTILKILGGKHMVDPEMVRVLGRSAFHDTGLTSSGDLCYLGGEVIVINFGCNSIFCMHDVSFLGKFSCILFEYV